MHQRSPLSLMALFACASISAQPLPEVDVPPDVAGVLRDYERAWSANDPDALTRLFAPEGLALPNGGQPARGAASIRGAYAQAAGMPLALRPIAYGASGDLAYVIGGFGPARGKPDFGKFTLVLRRVDGRWLIVSDMDNGNAPLPAPPAGGAAPTPSPVGLLHR